MKFTHYIICLISTFFFYCCSNDNIKSRINTIYLTELNIPPLQQLNFEKINLLEDEKVAFCFFVYKDSVLVINRSYSTDSFLLSIVNLRTHTPIGNYFRKGNGPNELLNIRSINNQNRIPIYDVVKNHISIFNLDSAISKQQYYFPIIQPLENGDFRDYDLLTDSSLIFYNSWHLKDCGNEANETAPELFISDLSGSIKYTPPKDIAYVANETSVSIISNVKKNRVFIAYSRIPQYTLLNSNLDTIKIIYGPDEIKKKNYKYKKYESEIYNTIRNSYISNVHSSDSYIFISNRRITGLPMKNFTEFSATIANNQSELFMFDWEGNLIARYQMPQKLCDLSFSETTNTLYITVRDENDELCLYKAQL